MKLILKEDVEKLGLEGDVVEVADGYGRNYLLPRGLAVEATPGQMKQMKRKRRRAERRRRKELEAAEETAALLNERTFAIEAKAGPQGRLFGSVTTQRIAEAIEEETRESVDRRKIELDEPLRETGVFPVRIRLHSRVIADINVRVVAEGEEGEGADGEEAEEEAE